MFQLQCENKLDYLYPVEMNKMIGQVVENLEKEKWFVNAPFYYQINLDSSSNFLIQVCL